MEQSILNSTKKILGIAPDYTVFDQDICTHINSAFFTLDQLGVGPTGGLVIEDETAEWGTYFSNENQLRAIKSYVYLRVRLLFDPPTTSYVITALQKEVEQLEWRLNVDRESTDWVDPTPEVIVDE